MHNEYPLPVPGLAEVRIIAATPEAARCVALAIRDCFEADEQRSYPAGEDNSGTRLNLTIDTTRRPSTTRGTGPRPALGNTVPRAAPHSDEFHVNLSGFRAAGEART